MALHNFYFSFFHLCIRFIDLFTCLKQHDDFYMYDLLKLILLPLVDAVYIQYNAAIPNPTPPPKAHR